MSDSISGGEERSTAEAETTPLGLLALSILRRWREAPGGLILITDSERRAERLANIVYALDPTCDVLVFPRWDRLPFERAPPSRETLGRRASVLRRLAGSGPPRLLITTPDAVLQRLPPQAIWAEAIPTVSAGARLDPADLEGRLRALGYALTPDVDEPGEAAFHGQTIDIFPAGALGPVRIEVNEGAVASIAGYDRVSQRTTGSLDSVVLDAASELVAPPGGEVAEHATTYESTLLAHYPQTTTVFDYLPDALRVTDGAFAARADTWLANIEAVSDESRVGSRSAFYLARPEWEEAIGASHAVTTASLLPAHVPMPVFALDPDPRGSLRRFLVQETKEKRIVLAAIHPDDLRALERVAKGAKLPVVQAATWDEAIAQEGTPCVSLPVDLDKGFTLPDEAVTIVAAADLLGSRARHVMPFDARRAVATEDAAYRFGDAVLHLEHGIGLLRGLETVEAPGQPAQDVARLEYAGGTDMLAPVGDLGAIWRYSGDAESVTLDKLNGDAWNKRRREIEADIDETAKGLIAMASARSGKSAPALRPRSADYERFVSGFAFTETPDQASAVEDILGDLASGTPMDRLVCGDVGFGKTEVALRAAAAAVLSGKQVAVVAPTTVLVRQHLETFAKRFAPLGIEVAQLSRLVKPADARAVRAGLKSGSIRLVIGTHALAAKGVAFADLGLVVIDEEQRFGMRDKEKVRSLATDCHLLAMTATPIPRTLMAARVGLQSLSLLATPPARRVPVRTSIVPFTNEALRDAIVEERQRGGQSFLVCPRVEDIPALSERLRSVLPDIAVFVVHGQLPPTEVDDAMVRFANSEGDVLLATNIIESGLDVPRANTILIVRPDKFGLAQLHQLRGRVGRSARRGKAFLLVDDAVAKSARKRLETFKQLGGIGAGFAISAQDMDQRGAGDLLGEQQAGHVKLLGADLHRHLLERAIGHARGEDMPEDWTPQMNLAVAACLPADYVGDPELRLNLYARLARLRSAEEIAGFREELDDRFGALPDAAEALLQRAALEQRCRAAGIMRVDVGPRGVALTFLTEANRPKRLPTDAEWKDERLLLKSPTDNAPDISTVMDIVESVLRKPDGAPAAAPPSASASC